MVNEIQSWLVGMGLGKYVKLFTENEIDLDAAQHLTEEDLKELGLPLGPRKKVLAAIQPPEELTATVAEGPVLSRPHLAERRQLTVLFCDLVGSTALSVRLDPEDMREVLRHYQDTVAGVISHHDGFVANYLGDGVLAYFGWPRAREDQAAQALRAGLAAVRAVASLTTPEGEALTARVGIATGQVVVGELEGESGHQAAAISGETPNLAARLQALAEPGQVVIGGQTRDLLGRQFDLADLGPQKLKGIGAAVPAWKVEGELELSSRFEARASGLVGFVGREHELGLLIDRWCLARKGEGQVVLLSGEAGIGKSRLIEELRRRTARDDVFRLTYQCAPQYANSAFWPVILHLRRAADFRPGDSSSAQLDKLEALVNGDREAAQLLAVLLSLSGEDRYGALELSPQAHKQRTIEALVRQLLALAERKPVLFLFEDAHWIDPSSAELLTETVARIADARVLMVVTTRPDWQAPWGDQPHSTTINLNRLARSQAAEIVTAIAGPHIGAKAIERVVSRTDGIPLFVEELTKALVERGLDAPDADIPATLQASLAARLDRLPPEAREIAQIGAVIGRRFPLKLLSAVFSQDAPRLATRINALLESGLVYRQGERDEAVFTFKHALVQDTAYESLLVRRRRELHRRVVDAMLGMGGDGAGYGPEVLAHHLSIAGDVISAAQQWLLASRDAIGKAAHLEAIAYLERALQGLTFASASNERDGLELDIQIALASASIASEGYAAKGTRRAYANGRRIMRRTPFDNRHTAVLYGLFVSNWGLGRLRLAETYARQLVKLANEQNDDEAKCVAHRSLAVVYNPMARYREALRNASLAFEFYDPVRYRSSAYRYGHDIGVAALSHIAVAQMHLGCFDEAQATGQRAIALARQIGHPNTVAYSLSWFGLSHAVAGDAPQMIKIGQELIAYTTERGLQFFELWGNSIEGAGHALSETDPKAALAGLRYGSLPFNFFKQFEAQALLQLACTAEANEVIVAALTSGARMSERWAEPELHRIQAIILGAGTAGNAALQRALECARSQEAAFSELRTALDLAKRSRGSTDGELTSERLAAALRKFGSDLDHPLLDKAKTLLATLDA